MRGDFGGQAAGGHARIAAGVDRGERLLGQLARNAKPPDVLVIGPRDLRQVSADFSRNAKGNMVWFNVCLSMFERQPLFDALLRPAIENPSVTAVTFVLVRGSASPVGTRRPAQGRGMQRRWQGRRPGVDEPAGGRLVHPGGHPRQRRDGVPAQLLGRALHGSQRRPRRAALHLPRNRTLGAHRASRRAGPGAPVAEVSPVPSQHPLGRLIASLRADLTWRMFGVAGPVFGPGGLLRPGSQPERWSTRWRPPALGRVISSFSSGKRAGRVNCQGTRPVFFQCRPNGIAPPATGWGIDHEPRACRRPTFGVNVLPAPPTLPGPPPTAMCAGLPPGGERPGLRHPEAGFRAGDGRGRIASSLRRDPVPSPPDSVQNPRPFGYARERFPRAYSKGCRRRDLLPLQQP